MRYISLDFESHLIKPGLLAPRAVCMSFAERDGDRVTSGLLLRADARDVLHHWLEDDEVVLIGHNIWYDIGLAANEWPELLPLIFKKLEKGLIHDTKVRMQLIDIAEGELKFHYDEDGEILRSQYHLSDLSYRLNKRFIKKGSDTWRLRYALLDGVPVENWPDNARKYAVDDAEVTLEVWEAQQRRIEDATWTAVHPLTGCKVLMNSTEQHKAAWALHLMSMWGLRTDGAAVTKLKAALDIEYATLMEKLIPSGLYNVEPARKIKVGKRKGQEVPAKISKNMKKIYARVSECYGPSTPFTEKGKVCTDRKTLTESGDEDLKGIAEAGAVAKLLNTYVPALEAGTRWPINPRFNVLVENGRTSCSAPNIQNPPRKGGVRECFVPRPGNVFASCDYDTIELRSLAQVCLDILGRSSMAEALRRGEELHLLMAAQMLNLPLEEAKRRYEAGDKEMKETRQQAKVANFGFPGGLGADSFKAYAEGFGLKIDELKAKELRRTWFETWSEMFDYFEWITNLTDRSEQLTQLRSGRVRGGASFCAAANSFFSGLTADGAKEALWMVARECYLSNPDGKGPTALFGSRPVIFLHDEIIVEIPYHDPVKASAAADRLAEVMIMAMSKWIVDVPITAKSVMMRRWLKGAEPVRLNGLLVPSRPVKTDDDKTKWVADVEQSAPVQFALAG